MTQLVLWKRRNRYDAQNKVFRVSLLLLFILMPQEPIYQCDLAIFPKNKDFIFGILAVINIVFVVFFHQSRAHYVFCIQHELKHHALRTKCTMKYDFVKLTNTVATL